MSGDSYIEDTEQQASPRKGSGRVTYGIHYLQLFQILSRVLNEIYKSRPRREYYRAYTSETLPSRSDMLVYLDHALRSWYDALPLSCNIAWMTLSTIGFLPVDSCRT